LFLFHKLKLIQRASHGYTAGMPKSQTRQQQERRRTPRRGLDRTDLFAYRSTMLFGYVLLLLWTFFLR